MGLFWFGDELLSLTFTEYLRQWSKKVDLFFFFPCMRKIREINAPHANLLSKLSIWYKIQYYDIYSCSKSKLQGHWIMFGEMKYVFRFQWKMHRIFISHPKWILFLMFSLWYFINLSQSFLWRNYAQELCFSPDSGIEKK